MREFVKPFILAAGIIGLLGAVFLLGHIVLGPQVPRLKVHDETAGFRTLPAFAGWEMHAVHLDGKWIGHLRHSAANGLVSYEYGPGMTIDIGSTTVKADGPDARLLRVVHRPVSGLFVDSESHALWAGDDLLGLLVLSRIGEPSLRFRAAGGGQWVDLYPLLREVK